MLLYKMHGPISYLVVQHDDYLTQTDLICSYLEKKNPKYWLIFINISVDFNHSLNQWVKSKVNVI